MWISKLILSIFLLQDSDGLKHCSNISNPGLSVCKTVEDYHPGAVPMPKPLHVKLTVRILNIVDLNWTENTMTLFLQRKCKKTALKCPLLVPSFSPSEEMHICIYTKVKCDVSKKSM